MHELLLGMSVVFAIKLATKFPDLQISLVNQLNLGNTILALGTIFRTTSLSGDWTDRATDPTEQALQKFYSYRS